MDSPVTEPEHTRWHRITEVEEKTSSLIAKGYTFTFNGKEYTFDTSPDPLSKLAVAYNVAKQYNAMNADYSQPMVMKDCQVAVMDRDSIISVYEAMIAYGLQIYNTHAQLIMELNAMTLEQLEAWVDIR